MRSIAAIIAVVCLGLGGLWAGTDGFRAITAEEARRLAVEREPRQVPPIVFEDQDGGTFQFSDYHGQMLVVDFFYTRCTSICPILNNALAEIRDALPPDVGGRNVMLLSISFDPEFDTPESLSSYARSFDADGRIWKMARVDDPAQLIALLKTFGVVVIPDGHGGFEHNGAIHLVGRDGRLWRIYDYEAPEVLAAKIGAM